MKKLSKSKIYTKYIRKTLLEEILLIYFLQYEYFYLMSNNLISLEDKTGVKFEK